MKYDALRHQLSNRPYFSSKVFETLTENPQLLRVQLSGWVKKGNIWPLKRGLYMLNPRDSEAKLTPYGVADVLYSPSYISLASAMSYYQMIPERVKTITSITTKKTQSFTNPLGHYTYQHVQPHFFQGFIQKEDEFGLPFMMATPEKAIVDFLYFQLRLVKQFEMDWFSESLRLQNIEQLNFEKVKQYAAMSQQKRLMRCIALLEDYDD